MKKLLLFVFAVMGFAACTQDVEVQVTERHDAPDTITVGFEGDDTRIQLNEAQKTVWTKGDQVSVFYFSDANQLWQYNGETGSRTANLKRVNAGEPTAQTTFNVVAYPYNEDYFLNSRTGALHATLPATQHYLKDSYGVGDNLMVAQSEFTQFSLKSVCGWLKLQLTGDGEVVKSINFKGKDGEQVAGLIHVDTATAEATLAAEMSSSDDNNAGGNLVFDDTILTAVTLDCGEGVTLGAEATAFYIALPPQTFEQGFTVEIEDTEGCVMEQSTDKALLIERNHIQPMAAFEFIKPNSPTQPTQPTQPTPASNEIWYSATAKVDPYFDDFLTFGSDLVSNVWDSETKRGIITFAGDVTMIGDDAFNNCDKFTGITLPESVTSIGKNAFYDCDGLTEFTIPDSVTTIGNDAFAYCDSLTSVTIGDSVTSIGYYAFAYCKSLTSVTIPDSVTSIGERAFIYCESLTSVTIGDSVTTIGYHAFYNCSSLTSVTIGDSVTSIGYYAFAYCTSLTSVNIPDSVTSIGEQAFQNCTSLTEFTGKFATEDGRSLIMDNTIIAYANTSGTTYTIPDSVTTIGGCAFAGCTSLTSVTIPDSVTTIGGYAFEYCRSLKKVYCYATIPPSLGNGVFSYNASGRRIYVYEECVEAYKSAWSGYEDSIYTNGKNCPDTTTIEYTTNDGNTITSSKLPIISNIYENGVGTLVVIGKISQIPNYAFENCDSLTSVNIPDSVTTIGESAFQYCTSLTSVNIPDSVTSIGNYAFDCCTSLTSVNIPDSVTTIGESAFQNCTSLTSVNIPDSVTTIGEWAFCECTSLTSVTIPDSVTKIGDHAFQNCDSLTSVYCKATTPPALGGTSVFNDNVWGRKIYVPTESVDAYKSATNWSVYDSDIVGYDF